ncbi:MAG: hypothetical protein AAF270_13380 [Pseudomonadota bacterium]
MTNLRQERSYAMTASTSICAALLMLLASMLATTARADDNCRQSMEISEELDLGGISEISVQADAGKLKLVGQAGLTSALVTGVACASDEDDLKQISIESSRDGATLVIRTVIPRVSKSWMGNNYARLDLEVNVPNNYPIRIVDTSGSMAVSDVASVEIEDGSGSIQVEDVAGAVDITDDGSGSISVVRAGSVRIAEDGSGSITASQITNDVYVGRDGSGSISATDVGGNFTVMSDSSGSVRHRNIAGEVRISD